MCLYDFISTLYKKKINSADLKYFSNNVALIQENRSMKGRPMNRRHKFERQHPQATTHIMMEHRELRVPVLFGPQVPREDREDTRERYCRAILTLFVPWRTVSDLCDTDQTWNEALSSRMSLISVQSAKIIENIQLLHECKKDRDSHLLQVIAEAESNSNLSEAVLTEEYHDNYEEYEIDDGDDLLDLLGRINDQTITMANTSKNLTEARYIEETIKSVENVGRFDNRSSKFFFLQISTLLSTSVWIHLVSNQSASETISFESYQQIAPFMSATSQLIRLNTKWKEQLKAQREVVRQRLIYGDYNKEPARTEIDSSTDALVTVTNTKNCSIDEFKKFGSILPVASIATSYPSQNSVTEEFTLNKEQRAAFMIITSHLDGESQVVTSTFSTSQ